MLMIRNIALYVQIPGPWKTCTKFQDFEGPLQNISRPGIQIFKFQDFPGFHGPVWTLFNKWIFTLLYNNTHKHRHLCGLVGSALEHGSLPPEFECLCGHIWRVFHLWFCFITFRGCSAHLAYHMHKSSHKTSINHHHHTHTHTHTHIHTVLTFLSEVIKLNASVTCSAVAPPPTSKKLAGLPPWSLMMSIVDMAKPAPFTITNH